MPDIASAVISKQWPMVQPEDGNRANTQSGLNKSRFKMEFFHWQNNLPVARRRPHCHELPCCCKVSPRGSFARGWRNVEKRPTLAFFFRSPAYLPNMVCFFHIYVLTFQQCFFKLEPKHSFQHKFTHCQWYYSHGILLHVIWSHNFRQSNILIRNLPTDAPVIAEASYSYSEHKRASET